MTKETQTRLRRKCASHFAQRFLCEARAMARLRHHYYCEACDGTWLAEAEVAVEADCKFCGARDVLPYRSDAGRSGGARLTVAARTKKSGSKAPARTGRLKRSA